MRPNFHFTASAGWINDPHGITYRNGGYEVFFQFVPDSLVWAPNCHWGHARGKDLLSLTELAVALAPGEGDDGVWTGSIAQAGVTKLFYTSVQQPNIGIGTVRMATPANDDWTVWNKGPQVAEAPADMDVIAYRDPFVTRDGANWSMFLGAGLADGTATALRYSSTDLEDWTYEGIALERSTNEKNPVWMGALWECPQFFDVDGTSVMLSSIWDDNVLYYAGYGIGELADGHFTARMWGQLSFGPSYYAPSFFRDADGRPCVVFWMRGIEDPEAGWASAHSIAYVLHVENDQLTATLHPDLDKYVREPLAGEAPVQGLAALITWAPSATDTSVTVRSGGIETLRITLDGDHLSIERDDQSWTLPYVGGEAKLLIDGPIAELVTSAGVFGVTVDPQGETLEVTPASSNISVSPLVRD